MEKSRVDFRPDLPISQTFREHFGKHNYNFSVLYTGNVADSVLLFFKLPHLSLVRSDWFRSHIHLFPLHCVWCVSVCNQFVRLLCRSNSCTRKKATRFSVQNLFHSDLLHIWLRQVMLYCWLNLTTCRFVLCTGDVQIYTWDVLHTEKSVEMRNNLKYMNCCYRVVNAKRNRLKPDHPMWIQNIWGNWKRFRCNEEFAMKKVETKLIHSFACTASLLGRVNDCK